MQNLEAIIAYEDGALSMEATLALFSRLVTSGMAWSLQGHYGRTAAELIGQGFLTEDGDITEAGIGLIDEES